MSIVEEQFDKMSLTTAQHQEVGVEELLGTIFSHLLRETDCNAECDNQDVFDAMFSYLLRKTNSNTEDDLENLLDKSFYFLATKTDFYRAHDESAAEKLLISKFRKYLDTAKARSNVGIGERAEQEQKLVDEEEKALQATHCNKLVIKKPKRRSDEAKIKRAAKRAERRRQLKIIKKEEEKLELIEACIHDDVAKVKELLAAGHNVNETSKEGHTLLIVACKAGSSQVVQFLLEKNAPIEDRGIDGDFTPLIWASSYDLIDVVNILLQHGALVDAKSLSTSSTSLIYAVAGENKEVVKALLQNGADVTVSNAKGHTPTLIAKHYQLKDILKILSEHS